MITLEQLNTIPENEAFSMLETCCVSKTLIHNMLEKRPFSSLEDLVTKSAEIWYETCDISDYKEAFTGHPKIGDVASLTKKFAHTQDWANNEQAQVTEANTETIQALADANTAYEARFGYIFIVSASGKSAEEMLAIVQKRMQHEPEDEIFVAMNEQHKITVIRLAKLVEGLSEIKLGSQLTTHALDTSIGVPAAKMHITLKGMRDNTWKPLSTGITNADGRIADVLPPGRILKTGSYLMVFDTDTYFRKSETNGFYPEVAINFTVTDDSHYHIPLLINPYGYTTYRGS